MTANNMQKKRGLYIHIPFCVKKCNYCAFLSFHAESSPRKEYSDALVNEIKMRADGNRIDTIYVGGGTPSVLDISQLRDIMHAVKTSFEIAPDAEITIEANPGTLGIKERVVRAKLQAYKSMGFNRLSMGVQSMDNDRLSFLGRIHTVENVRRDVAIAREMGFDNINLDLMFSIPGETTEDALSDTHKIMELEPEHISCYSLQIEEGTPFHSMIESGEIKEVADEEDRNTYHKICSLLKDAGYEHYEISNFAKPGFESKHNSLYWNMDEYIGCGLGASGFVGGVRYKNISDLQEYISAYTEEPAEAILEEEHVNTDFDNISEAVFTGLRRSEGIRYDEIAADKEAFWKVFADAKNEAEAYAESGHLIIDDEGMRLTEKGIDISNQIMSLFV